MSWFSLNKRYPAFTLTELLVGMVASGIVLSAIWAAFHIVSRVAVSSLVSKTESEEVSLLKRCLAVEFNRSQHITAAEDGFMLSADLADTIRYQFPGEFVLRRSGEQKDTFHVHASDLQLQNANGLLAEDEEGIETIQFTLVIDGIKQDILLKRTLSSLDLMKRND